MANVYLNNEMAGARVLNHDPGAIIDIFEQCLITGFGTQTPQGSWEIIKNPDGTKAAIRSTTSPYGVWLYIEDTGTQQAVCQFAESFTGFDEFDEPIGNISGLVNKNINKCALATLPAPWRISADDRFFYFFQRYHYAANDFDQGGWLQVWQSSSGISSYGNGGKWVNPAFAFGDLIDSPVNDGWPVVLFSQRGGSPTSTEQQISGALAGFGISTGQNQIARAGDQIEKAINAIIHRILIDPPYPLLTSPSGLVLMDNPIIADVTTGIYRGKMPGYYPIPHAPGVTSGHGLNAEFNKWDSVSSFLTGTPLENREIIITGTPLTAPANTARRAGCFDVTGPWR